MTWRIALGVIGAAAIAMGILAQSGMAQAPVTGEAAPKFEVASLKPSPPSAGDKIYINLGAVSHGTLTMANTSLADCLRYAYSLTNNDQLAGPDWIKSKAVRFDIVAKAPANTPNDQIRRMLQTLLTERFQMVMHREQKELSYVALVIGKKGPKLQKATEGSDSSGNKFLIGQIVSNHISMTMLATLLSRFAGQGPVLDVTGLKGEYDVKLEWTPDNAPAAGTLDAPDGPSLFGAVEQQLGLKLDERKGPVEILVVDHADKVPVQN